MSDTRVPERDDKFNNYIRNTTAVLEGDVVLWEEDVKLRTGVRSFRRVVSG